MVWLSEASIEAQTLQADLTDADLSGLDPATAGLSEAQCASLERWGFDVDLEASIPHLGGRGRSCKGGEGRLDQSRQRARALGRWCEVAPGTSEKRGVVGLGVS